MSRVGARKPASKVKNPFDSDSDTESEPRRVKAPSQPAAPKPTAQRDLLLDDNQGGGGAWNSSSSSSSAYSARSARDQYRNDFRDSGGFESQSVQELENYAVYKAEETTQTLNGCLRIAEDIRDDATKTLVTLHHQGEQITRSHHVAADMDHDLSRGEKLLGSLGGIFSKTWKPKISRPIKGPSVVAGNSHSHGNKATHIEQREKLGLSTKSKPQANPRQTYSEEPSALQKVEVEKAKQDDTLSEISNLLDDLKGMAVDMGSEIERHNDALGHMDHDVDVLNDRVKQSNRRGRQLLGK